MSAKMTINIGIGGVAKAGESESVISDLAKKQLGRQRKGGVISQYQPA
jgi:hypothetical protein